MAFSELQIGKLKPKPTVYDLTETGVAPDQRGLQLRVHPSGSKTWLYRYTVKGKTERVKLGNWPTMKLHDAHRALQEQRAKLREGIRPALDAKASKHQRQELAANTVSALADEFINRELRNLRKDENGNWIPHDPPRPVKRESWRELERLLTKDVLPVIGHKPMHTVRAKAVADLLTAISDRGASIGANRTHAAVQQMFRYGVGQGWLPADANPCRDVRRPLAKEPSRTRALDDTELQTFLRNLNVAAMLPMMKYIYRLILATGQRPGEVTRARWDEFDLDNAMWIIPAIRTKTREADHHVPLSGYALALLRELRALHDKPWLFPAHRANKDTYIADKAAAHAIRNNREFFAVEPFTPHDLRRSARTGLARIGVDSIVAKKILNHKLEGMDQVYNKFPYTEEKAAALEKWGQHLQKILTDPPATTEKKSKAKAAPTGKRRAAR